MCAGVTAIRRCTFPSLPTPPTGWYRGPHGIFTAPASAPSRQNSIAGTASSTPSSSAQSQPGTSSTEAPPSRGILDRSRNTRNTSSPSQALLRPSGSADIPIAATSQPYIPGIVQMPLQPRDPAQFVIRGAAATSVTNSLGAFPTSSAVPQNPMMSAFSPSLVNPTIAASQPLSQPLSTVQQQISAAKLRRQKELEEEQRRANLRQQQQAQLDQFLLTQQQQLLAADRAEEEAHQAKLKQLRASHSTPPFPLSTSPAALSHHHLIRPPAVIHTTQGLSLLAQHNIPPSFTHVPPAAHLAAPAVAPFCPHMPPHSPRFPRCPEPLRPRSRLHLSKYKR